MPRAAFIALCAIAGAGALAGCRGGEHREPTIRVVDRRAEQARTQRPTEFLLAPLEAPKDSTRIIYTAPTSLARVAHADTLVRPAGTTGGDVQPRRPAPVSGAAPAHDTGRPPQRPR